MSTREASRREARRRGQEAGRPAGPAGPVRLDIRQITLDGYSPGRRDHFSRALAAELAGRGAPEAAAWQAAEAILTAVDAQLGRGTGTAGNTGGPGHD